MAAGSSEKMVASSRSPWRRRTQRPSFRSMAGMSSMMLWIPINKIPVQTQTEVSAFFGMELYCENVSRCHSAGKACAVMAYPNSKRWIGRFGIVAVYEIKIRLVGNRSEESRVGKEGVGTCRYRGAPYNKKKK